MSKSIFYRDLANYKYQTMSPYVHETGLTLGASVMTKGRWVTMTRSGRITVKKGYAWDGPSGPTIDTRDFMRGSLVHDALYQLIRERLLPSRLRKDADQILYDICREDGMSVLRAEYVYHAVRAFGASSARPPKSSKKVIIKAP